MAGWPVVGGILLEDPPDEDLWPSRPPVRFGAREAIPAHLAGSSSVGVVVGRRAVFALTLPQPLPWAMLHLQCRLLNQQWSPPARLLAPGDWLAIHAGPGLSRAELHDLHLRYENHVRWPTEWDRSAIVALARFERCVEGDGSHDRKWEEQHEWYRDGTRSSWLFDAVVAVNPPIPCPSGGLNLWVVHEAEAEQLRAYTRPRT